MSDTTATIPIGAPAFVAVDDEPMHKQRWKSDIVRLVDAQVPAHSTTLCHQHLHHGIYVTITPIHFKELSLGEDEPRILTKKRGEVFCRDHTKDHLTYTVITMEHAVRIIEVELLRDEAEFFEMDELPRHEDPTITSLHEDNKCRVYRITFQGEMREVSLELKANAVVIVLDQCAVVMTNGLPTTESDKIHADHHTRWVNGEAIEVLAGDDLVLEPGPFTLQSTVQSDNAAEFILCEVF